jgi:hypothetical protein
MNELESLVIYKKYTDMMYYFYNLLDKYPKVEKNGLVSEIKNNLYNGLVCIINAYKSFDKKSLYLNDLDVHLKVLKVLVRISYRKKYISSKNYGASCRKIGDVNNLMYGWLKKCRKQ